MLCCRWLVCWSPEKGCHACIAWSLSGRFHCLRCIIVISAKEKQKKHPLYLFSVAKVDHTELTEITEMSGDNFRYSRTNIKTSCILVAQWAVQYHVLLLLYSLHLNPSPSPSHWLLSFCHSSVLSIQWRQNANKKKEEEKNRMPKYSHIRMSKCKSGLLNVNPGIH